MSAITYTFKRVEQCDMCGAPRDRHKMTGMRLNASQGLRPRRAEGIAVSVKRCAECDLIFADPLPIPASLSDHYGMPPEDYWGPNEWHWQWTPEYFATEIGHAKRLLPFAEGMKALDVGVGLGKSMKSLEHAGFEAYGIEPSEPFYDKALSIMQLDRSRVTLAAVEEAEFPENMFDFITFGAVLEHVYSPSLALSRALKWLKPGGIIQAEVPSSHHLIPKFLNLFFRLRGTNYVTNISPMHSPFHLFEFSLRSFEKNGQRTGYEVAHHDFTVCAIYHLPKVVHPPLRWWMSRNKSGMQLAVYLRKPA